MSAMPPDKLKSSVRKEEDSCGIIKIPSPGNNTIDIGTKKSGEIDAYVPALHVSLSCIVFSTPSHT